MDKERRKLGGKLTRIDGTQETNDTKRTTAGNAIYSTSLATLFVICTHEICIRSHIWICKPYYIIVLIENQHCSRWNESMAQFTIHHFSLRRRRRRRRRRYHIAAFLESLDKLTQYAVVDSKAGFQTETWIMNELRNFKEAISIF